MVQGQRGIPGFIGSQREKHFSAEERRVQFLAPSGALDPSDGGKGQRGRKWDCLLPACSIKFSSDGSIGQRREAAVYLRLWGLNVWSPW